MARKTSFVGLFSGCGGLDRGFEDMGLKCHLAVDISKYAIETYNYNNRAVGVVGDLASISPFDYGIKSTDILVAGPPCQGFSLIGKRDVNDPRNSLLFTPVKWASKLNPKVVLIENVASASSGIGLDYWTKLTTMLTGCGYKCNTLVLNAKNFGVPQNRLRSILFATQKEVDLSSFVDGYSSKCITSLDDVLTDLEGHDNHDPVFIKQGCPEHTIASRIKIGQKLCDVRLGNSSVHSWEIPEVFGRVSKAEIEILESIAILRRRNRIRDNGDGDPVQTARISKFIHRKERLVMHSLSRLMSLNYITSPADDHWELRRTFNGKYKRIDSSKISNCVITKFFRPTDYLHPVINRGLSVREAARIQGFPDHFKFFGPLESQWKQVGNAVPVPMSQSIARFILEKLL